MSEKRQQEPFWLLLKVLELDEDETERNKKVAGLSSFEQDKYSEKR